MKWVETWARICLCDARVMVNALLGKRRDVWIGKICEVES